MHESRDTDRRKVLKTLGAGVVGGVMLTGRAAAAADLGIDMVGDAFNFNPRRASIDVSSGNKTVKWTYVSNGGLIPPHDVHIAESTSLNTVYVHSGEGNLDAVGETYKVTFEKDGDDLMISDHGSDDDDDEKHGGSGTVTGAFSGSSSYTVDYVCSVHAEGMYGTLTVNG